MILVLLILPLFLSGPASVDFQRIESAVRDFVAAEANGSGTTLLVEIRTRPQRIVVPSEKYRVDVRGEEVSELRGYVGIPVEIVSEGRAVDRLIVSCYVRTFDSVLVARYALQKHAVLNEEGVTVEKRETTTYPSDVLRPETEIKGMRTRRMIAAGSILVLSALEQIPVVRQNAEVTVFVRSENAVVSEDAIAKEDGRIGDVIEVQRVGSHQRLRATVVGEHRVEIREPAR